MIPSLPENYLRNQSMRDAILSRESKARPPWASLHEIPYCPNIIFGELGSPVSGTLVIPGPPSGVPVFGVVGFSAAPEMCWITARRVVTGVQHKGLVGGYRAVRQYVGDAMSEYHLPAISPVTDIHSAVSSFVQERGVRPAGIGAAATIYSIVKMIYLFWCKLMGHGGSVLSAMSYPQPYQRCGGFYCTDYSIVERV